jgi:ribosome-binding protein aMBF1 (putative translation factor)
MPKCRQCESEVDRLVSVKIEGKSRKMCEDCADRERERAEVAEASGEVIRSMMGYKGRR